jgi:hypothetical protein
MDSIIIRLLTAKLPAHQGLTHTNCDRALSNSMRLVLVGKGVNLLTHAALFEMVLGSRLSMLCNFLI